jgi:hypothetical protein
MKDNRLCRKATTGKRFRGLSYPENFFRVLMKGNKVGWPVRFVGQCLRFDKKAF